LNITTIVENVGIRGDVNVQKQLKIKYYVEMPNSLNVTQKTKPTEIIYDLIGDLDLQVKCNVAKALPMHPKPFRFLKISYPCHICLQEKQKVNNH
jgi:hypothetical protein